MELVGAFCCSHAGLIVTRYDLASEEARNPIYAAYDRVREEIAGTAPSAIVIIATDHGRIYPLEFVPGVAIGVARTARSAGDSEVPVRDVPIHQDAAAGILRSLVDQGVDIAFSEAPGIDHSFMIPLGLINPDDAIPIVPITINCNTPPRPTFDRCREIGQALGQGHRRGRQRHRGRRRDRRAQSLGRLGRAAGVPEPPPGRPDRRAW